jgi:hypothetical protein
MVGKVTTYYLFIIYIFIFTNWAIFLINFFELPNFLFNLTNKKDHVMVSQNTINQVGRVQIDLSNMTKWSNWSNVKMIGFGLVSQSNKLWFLVMKKFSNTRLDLQFICNYNYHMWFPIMFNCLGQIT